MPDPRCVLLLPCSCTRNRILRAFIIEEQKIVKKVLLDKLRAGKKAEAAA